MATSRALLAFAYVADRFEQTGDIATGLLVLFAPVIAKRSGKTFDAQQFVEDVREMYDIEMHPYVAEDFAPRLAASGYLIETARFAENATYENGTFELPELPISEDVLEALLERFADFANSLLVPNGINIPRATLKSGLLDRLVQPDFLGLMVRPDRPSTGPRTMTLRPDPTANERPEDVERLRIDYLSARFILDCNESNPKDFDLLVAISSGALSTEVVLSLQHPPGAGDEFTGLQVVVDGPLIMDALGLGQDGPVKYAKLLIESIKRARAVPVVFEHTLEEIEGAIRSPLENYERRQDVYGILGRKLLTTPTYAPYLRSILGKLPDLVADLGISVLPFSDGDRAAARKYFTEANEEKLAGSIGMYGSSDTRLRDARSVSDVLRLRGPRQPQSIRDAGIVFVTRNGRLARMSRQFFVREALSARDYFPACITDRYLAGLLWITQGGGGTQLSRERLIANCTAAVVPRRDVVTKMHKFLSALSPTMADRFDALMTNERAEYFLMDRTVADVTLITDKNLEEIYRDVETIAGERVAAEKNAEIAAMRASHASDLERTRGVHSDELDRVTARATERVMEETTRAMGLETKLKEERRRADDAEFAAGRLRSAEAERTVRLLGRCKDAGQQAAVRARISIAVWMVLAAVALGLAARFVPDLFTTTRDAVIVTVVLIVVLQAFSVVTYLVFPDAAFSAYVKRRRDDAVIQMARDLDIEDSLADYEIDWTSGQIVNRVPASAEQGAG
jgi:hypothetical protein